MSVNYDAGMYLYDAKLITLGGRPIIDYPSRSPLFHLILLPAILVGFSPIVTARLLMVVISLTLGVVVYFVTKKIHTRGSGVAACIIFVLSPFVLIWGLWVKTEQVVQLMFLLGLLPFLSHLDDDRMSLLYPVLLGGAVGSAFFVRRVIIVHFVVTILFIFYYRYIVRRKALTDPLYHAVAFVASTGFVLFVGYVIWAGGSLQNFINLVNNNFISIFYEPGMGDSSLENLNGSTSLGNLLFSKIDIDIVVYAFTLILPALLLVLIYPVFVLKRWFGNVLILGATGILCATTALLVFIGTEGEIFNLHSLTEEGLFALQILTIVGLGFGAVALFTVEDRANFKQIWNPKLALPACLGGFTLVSYAVRETGIMVTYFQDVYPYIAIIGGVVGYELWQNLKHRALKLVGWGGLLLIAAVPAFIISGPLVIGPAEHIRPKGQLTLSEVISIGRDLNDRYGDGATGFSAQPLYMLEANHRVANDFSRKYWVVGGNPDTYEVKNILKKTARELESGRVQYVVVEMRTDQIMIGELKKAFRNNYCLAASDQYSFDLYRKAESALYVYDRGAPESCQRD